VIGQAEIGRLGASEMVTTGGGKGEEAQTAVGEGAKGARHGGEGGAEGYDIVDDEQPARGDGIDIAQGEDAFDVGMAFTRGEGGLRGIVDGAFDPVGANGNAELIGNAVSDVLALVVTALPQALRREGHGDNGLDAVEEIAGEEFRPHDSPDKAGEIGAVVVFEGVNEVSDGVFGLVPSVGIDALHIGFAPKEAFQGIARSTVEPSIGQMEPTRGANSGAGQWTSAHHATFAQKEGEGGTEGLPEVHAVGSF
jgi:hypothetical protein